MPGVALDHVAIAVERWADAWPRYAVQLGGQWSSGGLNVGFGPAQLRYANGAKVEVLQPWQTEANPFLRRFLDRSGAGPHHMTFKVGDLAAVVDGARTAGFNPVGVDTSDPGWMEAFLHPRQAGGVVVQLAQAAGDWSSPPPESFPQDLRDPPASLVRVTHAVADLDSGLALYQGLLGGTVGAQGTAPDGSWTYADVSWSGPLPLRLIAPLGEGAGALGGTGGGSALWDWLGNRPGRVHHLAFSFDAAEGHGRRRDQTHPEVPGVLDSEGAEVIEPDRNLGTRLVVLHPDRVAAS